MPLLRRMATAMARPECSVFQFVVVRAVHVKAVS